MYLFAGYEPVSVKITDQKILGHLPILYWEVNQADPVALFWGHCSTVARFWCLFYQLWTWFYLHSK